MRKAFDYKIEALRGFCAIIVLLYHFVFYSNILNNGYYFQNIIAGYNFPGHLMVLIFFMLSGYVIGLTYLQKEHFSVASYIKKRVIRLYPIYLFSILLTIILFKETSKSTISTLFFTQTLLSDNLGHNGPLWSLNHEFVYYLLVIPILKFKISLRIVLSIIISLIVASLAGLRFPIIIEGYLVGFLFWLSGFYISSINIKQTGYKITDNKFISLLFFLLACNSLNILPILFNDVTLAHSSSRFALDWMVQSRDFQLYFFSLYAIIEASSTNVKYKYPLRLFVYALCWTTIGLWILNGTFFHHKFFYIPLLFLILSSLVMFFKKPFFEIPGLLKSAGSISYALYVIHTPLILAIGSIKFLSGTLTTFLIRVSILFITTIAMSLLLEKVLQPKIKTVLSRVNLS